MPSKSTIPTQTRVANFENFLVEKKFLSLEALNKAKSESGTAHRNLFDYLVSEKYIGEEELTRARGQFFNLSYIDLRNLTIRKEVIEAVSKDAISNYKFLPFELSGNTLKVAVTDPTNLGALGALEFLSQKQNLKIET